MDKHKLKPSEILKTIKKKNWTTGKYWRLNESDLYNDRFCFNGFIINKVLGYPEPCHGTADLFKVYGVGYQIIHDIITDINDEKQSTFTSRKNRAIAFLEREGL